MGSCCSRHREDAGGPRKVSPTQVRERSSNSQKRSAEKMLVGESIPSPEGDSLLSNVRNESAVPVSGATQGTEEPVSSLPAQSLLNQEEPTTSISKRNETLDMKELTPSSEEPQRQPPFTMIFSSGTSEAELTSLDSDPKMDSALEALADIRAQVENFKDLLKKLEGNGSSKEYQDLEKSLHKCMSNLDNYDTMGIEQLRKRRKEVSNLVVKALEEVEKITGSN